MSHPSSPSDQGENPQAPGRHKKRHPIRTTLLVVAGLFVLLIGFGAFMDGGDTTTEDPAKDKAPATEPMTEAEEDEANDVQRFILKDHSAHGLTDIRVNYKITNDSSETSDYELTYEVVNRNNGNRIWDSYIAETNVRPGQSATGEDPINIPEKTKMDQYKINVTKVDRTVTP